VTVPSASQAPSATKYTTTIPKSRKNPDMSRLTSAVDRGGSTATRS
jgi:hypothetical protein